VNANVSRQTTSTAGTFIKHEPCQIKSPTFTMLFFKQVLSDSKLADTFLREHLPADVVGLLGPEPPEPVRAPSWTRNCGSITPICSFAFASKPVPMRLAYVLLEHKSSSDPGARLQLLRYVVRILTHCYEQNRKKLPLLAHQGRVLGSPLRICRPVRYRAGAAEFLPALLPSWVVDLAQVEDPALSTEVRLRAFLKALKYSRRSDLPDCIDILLSGGAPALHEKDLFVILTYLDKGRQR